jgi:hydrogenase expression/formation protein HypC
MCMAIPSRVVAIGGDTATVECFGTRRVVSLALLEGVVAPGDYLLVQAGGFAFEVVEAGRAQEVLALMRRVLEAA